MSQTADVNEDGTVTILGTVIGRASSVDSTDIDMFQVSGFVPGQDYVGKISGGVVAFDFIDGTYTEYGLQGLDSNPKAKSILELLS